MAVGVWSRARLAAGGVILAVVLITIFLGQRRSGSHTAKQLAGPVDKRSDESHSRAAPIDDQAFVGMDACGNCHTRIWRQYRASPMGRSLATPLEAVPQIEHYDDTEFAPPGLRRYRVERDGDVVRHHESLRDTDGSLVYDQSHVVSYALGSGKRGRSYIFERDGMLLKSSISWFSDRREWGLSPDYVPDSHKRFDRRITEGCINCHAGRVAVDRAAPDKFASPAVIEAAIGCERCHGAGARHVAAHESTDSRRLADELIINPAQLDTARQLSICAQCHLHGEARVIRSGQRACDFQPGQLLEENRIVFVAAAGPTTGSRRQALSQVEQMVLSACYRGSEGRMSCTSCHDPHGNPAPETRVDFYRAKCLACHETRACSLPIEERTARDAEDSCMACHMPNSLELSNILHVSFSDHRVPRRPVHPSEESPVDSPAAGEIVIFDHVDQRVPQLEVDRAWAFALVGGTEHTPPSEAGARRAEQLLLPVIEANPGDVDALEILGTACLMQQRSADAEKYWRKALDLAPRRESVLRNLGTINYEQRKMTVARDYLQRYLEVNPQYGFAHAKYAGALGALGDWPGCITAAELALERNPTLAAAHELLAYAYLQVGKQTESQQHRQLFEVLRRLVPRAAVEE
jgi:predicted CXXCH cytochrome family protein